MIILGTNSIKASSYDVDNSCMFDGTSSYMTKTLGTPTSAKKGTISYWFKQGSVRTGVIKTAFSFGSEYGAINYDTGTTRGFEINLSNGNGWYKGTNEGFTAADPSAWWHLVVSVDTTQGTEANRFKFYMNGSQITFTSGNNFPSSNGDIPGWASGQVMQVGRRSTTSNKYFDGYMAEVVFIDGSALTPSDFGEYNSDSPTIWQPKDVSGLTFGNNGFYLDFKDSSNLGNDANGGTDLTETGLDATNQATDTPTNNFATLNSLANRSDSKAITLSEGNCLQVAPSGGGDWTSISSTFGVNKGKWWAECNVIHLDAGQTVTGIISEGVLNRGTSSDGYGIHTAPGFANQYKGIGYQFEGYLYPGSGGSRSSYGASYGQGDIINIALLLELSFGFLLVVLTERLIVLVGILVGVHLIQYHQVTQMKMDMEILNTHHQVVF